MTFPVLDGAFAGFRLIRDRFRTVLAWGLLSLLVVMLVVGLVFVVAGPTVLSALSRGEPGSMMEALSGSVGALAAVIVLVGVIGLAATSVLQAGVYRAVLRPDEPGVAGLRLGPDEARLMAVNIIVLVLFALWMGLIALLLALLLKGLPLWVGELMGAPLLMLATLLFMALFCLAGAASFAERRVAIVDSVRLTARAYLSLCLMIVVVFAIGAAMLIVLQVVGALINGVLLISVRSQGASSNLMAAAPAIAAGLSVVVLFALGQRVFMMVLTNASQAFAYRALKGPDASAF